MLRRIIDKTIKYIVIYAKPQITIRANIIVKKDPYIFIGSGTNTKGNTVKSIIRL